MTRSEAIAWTWIAVPFGIVAGGALCEPVFRALAFVFAVAEAVLGQ